MRSVMARYSVETTSCSAFMAAFIVCHARLAHFTRIGYSRTPESTASLPSASISTSEVAGAVSIVWNFSKNASASRTVLPFSSSVIIDAEAFEMAQPVPWNARSLIVSPSTYRNTVILSPHSGL